jgi:hypothetical protein
MEAVGSGHGSSDGLHYHHRMRRILGLAVLGSSLAAALLAAQRGNSAPARAEADWLEAVDDWEAGRYPDALRALIALTAGPSAAAFHDRVALLTGELYPTLELTPDGRSPQISRTGQYVTYQRGSAADVRTVLVETRPSLRVLAELPTTVASFDPAGARLAWLRAGASPEASEIVVRDLASGTELVLSAPGLLKTALAWPASGDGVLVIGAPAGRAASSDVYLVSSGAPPAALTDGPGLKSGLIVDPRGSVLLYYTTMAPTAGSKGAPPQAHVLDLKTRASRVIPGVAPGTLTLSADGSAMAWIAPAPDGAPTVYVAEPTGAPRAVRSAAGAERISAPALSPDGLLVAYQFQARIGSSTDWEIYVSDRSGSHRRVTLEIQHDVLPRFLDNGRLLAMIGEPRHRRSYVHDLSTRARTRVFSNNSVRTISPEYGWFPSGDGTHLLVQADRDGDTISPARGLYLVDLTGRISQNALAARLQAQLRQETDLRNRMTAAYAPLDAEIRAATSRISTTRVFECQRAQAAFGSKHVTQPGNLQALEHLRQMYASFGYTPEVQWFNAGGGPKPGPRTANVVATLRGTTNPELMYVASSHFDSVTAGPGADDDTSGTCALLEVARVLASRPLPATVVFASLTAEEIGLFGSGEFVRLARERQWRVMGALNNDMIGWAADRARVDNTIRFSNRGIRDLQHGAAFLFSELVTYDAHYFYGTDAATFHEAWGDVFAGIGSYPILGNPNYHQATDLPETISYRQVAETAKVTAATLVALASSPARVSGLAARRRGGQIDLSWNASPEAGVTEYLVAYGLADEPERTRTTVKAPRASIAAPPGTHVNVKAINKRGLASWDWARMVAD